MDCQVDRIIEEDGICHIFAKILERLADPELLMIRGILKMTVLRGFYFMGDGHQRVYRYLDDRVDPMGSFYEESEEER